MEVKSRHDVCRASAGNDSPAAQPTLVDRTGYELGVEESCGGRALRRRSVRFVSGGTKGAATAQPRTDEVKIGSKPRHVNPRN